MHQRSHKQVHQALHHAQFFTPYTKYLQLSLPTQVSKSPQRVGLTSGLLLVLMSLSSVMCKIKSPTRQKSWVATIALIQPHAAHAAFTHGLSSKWWTLLHWWAEVLHGSVQTSLQTFESRLAVRSLISLCQMQGKPPFRAWQSSEHVQQKLCATSTSRGNSHGCQL